MREKVAIVGCGAISLAHGYPVAYRKDVELVAVCDIKEERAKKIAKILNCPRTYTDYKKMIDKEKIDIIHLCTPHYLHPIMAIYSLQHGINVITEKPMSIKLKDAEAMIECAKKNNVKLEVIFQNRFNAASQLVKNTLVKGELGKVISAKATLMWNREKEYYDKSDWKGTWDKEGGGVIIDQAIHTLDLVRWFIDSPIKYVQADLHNRLHNYIDVEDSAEGIIEFKNDVIVSFYAINYYGYDSPVEIELYCEHGVVQVNNTRAVITFNNKKQYIADVDQSEKEKYGPFNKDCWGISHIKQINSFYNYIRGKSEQYVDVIDVLETQKLICGIYESNRTKEKVYINK